MCMWPSCMVAGYNEQSLYSYAEAAVLPIRSRNANKVTDYWEKLVLSLSSVKALTVKLISKAEQNQKDKYDRCTTFD